MRRGSPHRDRNTTPPASRLSLDAILSIRSKRGRRACPHCGWAKPKRVTKHILKKYLLKISGIVFALIGVTLIGGLIYWQSLKSSPQYSLALLVNAAQRDDHSAVATLVDSDAVVEGLLPQVVEKAVEIYGRGQSDAVIQRAMRVAQPLMPAAKEKARAELPGLIRRETSKFGDVSFPLMVLGANRYLDIRLEGDKALVKRKGSEQDLEVTMVRFGEGWKITAVRDDHMAAEIAKRIGQEIIAMTAGGKKSGLGVKSIDALIDQMQLEQ